MLLILSYVQDFSAQTSMSHNFSLLQLQFQWRLFHLVTLLLRLFYSVIYRIFECMTCILLKEKCMIIELDHIIYMSYNCCPSKVHFRANVKKYAITLARRWTFDGHQMHMKSEWSHVGKVCWRKLGMFLKTFSQDTKMIRHLYLFFTNIFNEHPRVGKAGSCRSQYNMNHFHDLTIKCKQSRDTVKIILKYNCRCIYFI